MKRTRLCESEIHDNKISKFVINNTMADNAGINAAINLMGKRNPSVDSKENEKENKNSLKKEETEESDAPECAVCLQPRVHPAELPCRHVFCYLCVKGVANQSKKCPMCRQDIPPDFLDRPRLVELDEVDKSDGPTEEEFHWFYEGRNGWWQYDRRTSSELELAFKEGARSCELLIAGFLYVADFALMLQLRKNDPSRRRKIKRDLCNIPKKGVAGLRFNEHEQREEPIVREIRGAERPATPIIISDDEGDDDDQEDDEDEDEDYLNENEDYEQNVGPCSSTNDTT